MFTLWIEAEIFESGAERDRGERGIEEAERRLKAFAGEVTRRGLGDRRTLKVRNAFTSVSLLIGLGMSPRSSSRDDQGADSGRVFFPFLLVRTVS